MIKTYIYSISVRILHLLPGKRKETEYLILTIVSNFFVSPLQIVFISITDLNLIYTRQLSTLLSCGNITMTILFLSQDIIRNIQSELLMTGQLMTIPIRIKDGRWKCRSLLPALMNSIASLLQNQVSDGHSRQSDRTGTWFQIASAQHPCYSLFLISDRMFTSLAISDYLNLLNNNSLSIKCISHIKKNMPPGKEGRFFVELCQVKIITGISNITTE